MLSLFFVLKNVLILVLTDNHSFVGMMEVDGLEKQITVQS